MKKLKTDEIAKKLGAHRISLPEITKEASEQYELLGSPFMVPGGNKSYIHYFGSRMLDQYGKSLQDVVGYRIVDSDEEREFREQCYMKYPTVVCYYGNKSL